jgi:hypothetical protein
MHPNVNPGDEVWIPLPTASGAGNLFPALPDWKVQ